MYRSILVPVDVEQATSWGKFVPTAVTLCRCFSASPALTTVVPDQQLATEAEWSAAAFRRLITSQMRILPRLPTASRK